MKYIISGGGTGGHIFPAIAIANALKKQDPAAEFLFVGAEGRMEMEKVPAAGYKIEGLWISGLQRRLTVKNLLFPVKVVASMLKARKIVKQFRPDAAVGTGGYASGPLLRAASGMGIPSLIQEQNSFPGITNKLLASKVQRICVAYEGMEKYFPKSKIVLTGNPVRQDILNLEGKREEGMKFFGLEAGKKTLLVIGGSLGARTINESMAGCLDRLLAKNIQVIWQTGKSYEAAVKGKAGVWAGAFITRMDLAYACADAVVSRAGAISLSELALVKKPCILVPSPNVAEDHQTKNAMALVNKKAALLVKDAEARTKLGDAILNLMEQPETGTALGKAIGELGLPNAADQIAGEVLKMIKK